MAAVMPWGFPARSLSGAVAWLIVVHARSCGAEAPLDDAIAEPPLDHAVPGLVATQHFAASAVMLFFPQLSLTGR